MFVGQGSPNEQPEHATEYEFGASRALSHQSTLDVSLYHTNLRNPVEVFYPLTAVAASTCAANSYATPIPACVSSQGNVGNAVYTGAELRLVTRFAQQHAFVNARYGINSAYPKDLNAQFSNLTSGGNLVANAQFLSVPQQQGSLQIDWNHRGWHAAAAAAIFRGENNELNLARSQPSTPSSASTSSARASISHWRQRIFSTLAQGRSPPSAAAFLIAV